MTDTELLAKALSTPAGYAKVKLGIDLHPKQKDVLESVFRDKKCVFRAANGVGKTSMVLVVAILYAIEILNAQVISTSATYRQVTSQLMPCLKKYQHLYPGWEFLENAISVKGEKRYIGFSADSEGTFQGYHEYPGKPLLIIVDEAAGINDSIFRAIDRCQPTYYLVTGSPLSPEGEFYNLETKPEMYKYFSHIVLTQPECPWIKKENIDMMITKWGDQHPLVLSSVYAQFSLDSDNAIIRLSALEKCINEPCALDELDFTRRVFIDVAAGGDQNVIALRHSNKVFIVKKWRNKDTMSAAGEILIELQKLKQRIGLRDSEVAIDVDGLGIGIANRLQELGWNNLYMFHGNSPPKNENYLNTIAEVWIDGCKMIEDCKIIIPNDPELKAQLLARHMKIHSNGKMKLETKEDMRSRGVSSPDVADAVLGCMYNFGAGLLTFVKPISSTGYGNKYVGMYH